MRHITWRPILFSSINASLMFLLTLVWLSMPRTFGDEAFFIRWSSLVKKTVLGIDPKPPAEEFLYIDVSQSKALLPVEDPIFQESTGFNHVAITDRANLAQLVTAISQYGSDIELVLFDIFFEHPTPDDSLLQTALDQLPFPKAGAVSLNGAAHPEQMPIQLPTGVAMYLSVDENFMKYPLYFQDSLPTLPLVALREGKSAQLSQSNFWSRINGQRSLPNPIIDFQVRPFDLQENGRYSIYDMGSLLFQFSFWEEADIAELFSGKTIVIGDFQNDHHQTIFGTVPGPVIVHNAYLTLQVGDSIIRWKWTVFLLTLFFWMNWRVYQEVRSGHRSWLWKKSQTSLGKIVADSIDDTFFLAIGTILSYFVFNIHINILVLLVYLKITAWLLRRFAFRTKKAALE